MARRQRGGFALLITLTLLAFLVLLLVGLATFTKVETQISDNTAKQTQARRNALMALHIALGQLQKYAGPDTRVTATAEAFGGVAGTNHYTGVWDSTTTGATPLTWLVSGNERTKTDGTSNPLAVVPTTTLTTTGANPNAVGLVDQNTSGVANDVVAQKVAIQSSNVPGQTGPITVGNYAWWVGDQGVKAAVTAADQTSKISYAPFNSAELNARIRQQMGIGAGAADASGTAIFEPRSVDNSIAITRTIANAQIALLTGTSGSAKVGINSFKDHFHSWTNMSSAVIADAKNGGLKQDVSLNHKLLGDEFTAWANYTNDTYMENPQSPTNPAPAPAYGTDPLRRRYIIGAYAADTRPRISPVLCYFYILFGVQKTTGAAPYTLSLRWAAALWNPYSSSLVPPTQGLRLEITGLPSSISFMNASTQAVDATVSLRNMYGDPLKLNLPWNTSGTTTDLQSWLPGRVYNWVNTPDSAFASGATNIGNFYSRDLTIGFAKGLMTTYPGTTAINGSTLLAVSVPTTTTLTVKLYLGQDSQPLATYTSPPYDAVATTAGSKGSNSTAQLGFLFRLSESYDTPADPNLWLSTAQLDPRATMFPSVGLRALPYGTNPALYVNDVTIAAPWRLLDRDITWGTSYNEDVPLFELPRMPLLSLGALQHLYIDGARPFSIGNSWGNSIQINGYRGNEVFDRFFFSGLEDGVTLDLNTQPLPTQLLAVLKSKPNETPVALSDLRGALNQRSSIYMMQSAAFNVNSMDSAAWTAMLRSNRFDSSVSFNYLNPLPTSDASSTSNASTAADSSTATDSSTDAQFFRFSQSAQEVYAASPTYVQSTTNAGGSGLIINTHLFRRGRRTLTGSQIAGLAAALVGAMKQRTTTGQVGPFRSLEEFLNPSEPFKDADGNQISLLEYAIANAAWTDSTGVAKQGLNADIGEFSSQWLTQADVMTALAPVLFPRSDTFVIRAYGEAVNPALLNSDGTVPLSAIEGHAWLEAIVQRFPEPFQSATLNNPTDAEYQSPPGAFGRRFKIISFRWLTNSDI